MVKWIDLPPVWLGLMAALAWLQSRILPLGGAVGLWADLIGGVLIVIGLGLILFAALELRRSATTIIPHLQPRALVQSGIFGLSRNPIYLGDTLILAGLIVGWRAWLSLPLLALFPWIVTRRFIRDEEARLRARFPEAFDAYAARTRRWL